MKRQPEKACIRVNMHQTASVNRAHDRPALQRVGGRPSPQAVLTWCQPAIRAAACYLWLGDGDISPAHTRTFSCHPHNRPGSVSLHSLAFATRLL